MPQELIETYMSAGLTEPEIIAMPGFIAGDGDFFETEAFDKLFEHFAFETCEMPYGTAKARDGDPEVWILEHLEMIQEKNEAR